MDSDPVNVQIEKDHNGNVRSVDHLQEPYIPKRVDSEQNALSISELYIREQAKLYGINDECLDKLHSEPNQNTEVEENLKTAKGTALYLAEKPKTRPHTTVVSYQRAIHGLSVWQEGISITLNNDLKVVSSFSTIRKDENAEVPEQTKWFTYGLKNNELKRILGYTSNEDDGSRWSLHITSQRRYQYAFVPGAREEKHDLPDVPFQLPPLREGQFQEGTYYPSMEVIFVSRGVTWRVFIETKSEAVLYIRPLIACLHGYVYTTDPLTRLGVDGPTTNAGSNLLDGVREWKELPALVPLIPQRLVGDYIKIIERDEEDTVQDVFWSTVGSWMLAPGPIPTPGNFDFSVHSPHFGAVNAYYHLTSLFRLVERLLGCPIKDVLSETRFPLPVDYLRLPFTVDAKVVSNATGNAAAGIAFGVAERKSCISNACDLRVVAHEFGHVLLWDATGMPSFAFAHSAGDALGSILCDPITKLEDPGRFRSFPWTDIDREHNRCIDYGFSWGGHYDDKKYFSEQILSTSLFRAYRSIGGDSTEIKERRWASKYMLYLIFTAIASLPSARVTPIATPIPFVNYMISADQGTILGSPGGAIRKVIRWSFEEQGLYRPEDVAVSTKGGPPSVDVYIETGETHGEYEFTTTWNCATEIWNRRDSASDPENGHQDPLGGAKNYVYVRIKNRGTNTARGVNVYAYHLSDTTETTWPDSFEATTTPPIENNPAIPPRESQLVGPFEWIPLHGSAKDSILVAVSATGDLSNIDPRSSLPCAKGPVEINKLVPFDNNIGLREMTIELPKEG